MISQARTFAGVDDAAGLEAVGEQQALHHEIVGVRVGPQVVGPCGAPRDAQPCHAARLAVGGQSMDDAVGLVVQPSALDAGVGGVFPYGETEGGDVSSVRAREIAVRILREEFSPS